MKQLTVVLVLVAGSAFAQASPRAQTAPIPSGPTAANDTAIWVHPTDPNRSLVFGTDQVSGGLYSYGLDGTVRQQLNLGLTLAVDVRYNILLGGGVRTDIVLAANLDGTFRLLAPDRDGGALSFIDVAPTVTGSNASAATFYYSYLTRELQVYIADTTGKLRQYGITGNGSGKFVSNFLRVVNLNSQVDGIASDDLRDELYLTLANRGLFTLQSPRDGITTPVLVESIDAGHLQGAAGVAIYYSADGGGYVIVSASQTSRYPVYSLGTGAYLTSFNLVTAGALRGPTNSRGIEVMNIPVGTAFPRGLFVAHDPNNPTGGPNYKLVGWEDIATPPLSVDTRLDPRSFLIVDAGKPDAGTKCVVAMVDAGGDGGLDPDAGAADGGDAGKDAGVDCIPGTGGGGGSGMGGGFPTGAGGGGFEEPKGCGCNSAGLLAPLAALAWLLRRRRAQKP